MVHLMRSVVVALVLGSVSSLKIAGPTQKDVNAERATLEKMSTMLTGLLSSHAMSQSKVAPALKLFANNLHAVLNDTQTMTTQEAMKKLMAAKAGVTSLVGELTKTQESLMKENAEQQQSLLMGVLMTHQKESMDKQMEILNSSDFRGLAVTKALLSTKDTKTPLYLQAAQFLDAHQQDGSDLASKVASHASRVEVMAASLERRVTSLEKDAETHALHHKNKVDALTKLANAGGKSAKIAKASLKREERAFKKWEAMQKHDIESMKEAVKAVRSGDVKALNRARAALQASLEALKNKNSGIVVFLQQGNTILGQDCPYCAAQCVEKCHNNGESYVSCLGECADAGK